MQEKINAFYLRLEAQSKKILQFGLPSELKNLISFKALKTIYFYLQVPDVRAQIEKELLTTENSYRLDKEDTQLDRTVNLIIDPISHDIQLILETKSKIINQDGLTEKSFIPVFSGTTKSTKPAWRIDTPTPIKMANAVFYAHNNNSVDKDLHAARISALIAKSIVENAGIEALPFINVTALGVERKITGLRKHTTEGEPLTYYAKQSYYSPYALGDLYHILNDAYFYQNLFLDTRHDMVGNLLQALKFTHSAGVIHQDIKAENILVNQNEKGDYILSLTDFGLAYHPTLGNNVYPLATVGFESPEILALYDNQDFDFYSFFHESPFSSYGKDIYDQIIKSGSISLKSYKTDIKPAKENDIWALGVLSHEIYKNKTANLNSDYSDNRVLTGLLEPKRENRLTAEQALNVFNEMPPPPSPPFSLHEKIKEFYLRIDTQAKKLLSKGLPSELKNLILLEDLQGIYHFLLKPLNQATLFKTLIRGMPYRLDKNDTFLARTLNIVFTPVTGDIQLLLETKSKMVNKIGLTEKVPIRVCSGTSKSVKPAWRIDTPIPIKTANAVFYCKEKDFIDEDLNDERSHALIEKSLIEKFGQEATPFFNLTAMGVERKKIGLRRHHNQDSESIPYFALQSYYSEYALGDLEAILNQRHLYNLTTDVRNEMNKQLLLGVQFMHKENIVHQDLKPKNIVVYPQSNGGYLVKIIDFGSSYHPFLANDGRALSTYHYESPEISAVYWQKKYQQYDYYHDNDETSYGKYIYHKIKKTADFTAHQLASYKKPHEANDIWALGIILHEVSTNKKPKFSSHFKGMPVIAGLLQPNREERITIDKALILFEEKLIKPMIFSEPVKSNLSQPVCLPSGLPSKKIQAKK